MGGEGGVVGGGGGVVGGQGGVVGGGGGVVGRVCEVGEMAWESRRAGLSRSIETVSERPLRSRV